MAHQPARDNDITLWLKTRRDAYEKQDDQAGFSYSAIDALLDEYQEWADTGTSVEKAMADELNPLPKCDMCHRRRDPLDTIEHPMDAYDYSPVQAVTGRPLGWFSDPAEGNICPECMTKMIRNQ